MIRVLNYGIGNSAAVVNMVRKAGGDAEVCSDPSALDGSSGIVLPGVGSFDNGMHKLQESGFVDVVQEKVLVDRVPFLAICLGMQLLFNKSEEGTVEGLGWLEGEVTRFCFDRETKDLQLKVPHMGWNLVEPLSDSQLFNGIPNTARFYFTHSFHVNCVNAKDVLATSSYGYNFTAAVRHRNIVGVQFHPEKSHRFGLKFFQNFLRGIE